MAQDQYVAIMDEGVCNKARELHFGPRQFIVCNGGKARVDYGEDRRAIVTTAEIEQGLSLGLRFFLRSGVEIVRSR